MSRKKPAEPVAHIYAQEAFHDEAFIVGNRDYLHALRDAITAALKGGFGKAEGFVSDGEGFDTMVVLHDHPLGEKWSQLQVPYTIDYARERRQPWDYLTPACLYLKVLGGEKT